MRSDSPSPGVEKISFVRQFREGPWRQFNSERIQFDIRTRTSRHSSGGSPHVVRLRYSSRDIQSRNIPFRIHVKTLPSPIQDTRIHGIQMARSEEYVTMLGEPLPTKSELLHACRGIEYDWHPILRAAHALTELHERRLGAGDSEISELDRARAGHVADIDCCVTSSLPPAHGSAHVHTETLGAVVDRVAQFTATAYAALASPVDWRLCDAWERLAELAVGYEDLIAELHTGRRRLPGGP